MQHAHIPLTLTEARTILQSIAPFVDNGGAIDEDWYSPGGEYG